MSIIFQPFLSIDIETSGLVKDNPYILEIGAHFEDFGFFGKKRDPKENIFHLCIDNGELSPKRCSKVAMEINAELLKKIKENDESDSVRIVNLEQAKKEFRDFIIGLNKLLSKEKIFGYDPTKFKIQPGGKNFGGFDSVIFNQNNFELDELLHHRVVDPGPMYYTDFGFIPSLDQINKKLGRGKVTHIAIDDAMDVSFAVAHLAYKKLGM